MRIYEVAQGIKVMLMIAGQKYGALSKQHFQHDNCCLDKVLSLQGLWV